MYFEFYYLALTHKYEIIAKRLNIDMRGRYSLPNEQLSIVVIKSNILVEEFWRYRLQTNKN